MSEFSQSDVLKEGIEFIMLAVHFAEKIGAKPQTIKYAADNDKIDYMTMGAHTIILGTEKTLNWVPQRKGAASRESLMDKRNNKKGRRKRHSLRQKGILDELGIKL